MKKLLLLFALLSHSLFAITIIGSPNVEINPEGLFLVKIRISSTSNLRENDISFTNFKSDGYVYLYGECLCLWSGKEVMLDGSLCSVGANMLEEGVAGSIPRYTPCSSI